MQLNLSDVTFENDFFSTSLPSGDTLILNKIDEDMKVDGVDSVAFKKINIIVYDADSEENILCSSVIGIGNSYVVLNTLYSEYKGLVLTEDNMQYCYLEIPDE